jgi:hypothetical protein
MKRLLQLLALSTSLLSTCALPALRAEMPIDDAQLTGTANQVKTGATLTFNSGAALTVAPGATATAPAWFLGTFTASTITTGQNGIGWDENGRVTVQTPVGALQFYTTGSPSESVIYWPGRIITNTLQANATLTTIDAALITSTGSTVIEDGILKNSLSAPLRNWAMGEGYAGASGLPYVADVDAGGGNEPTVGVYFPQVNVTAGGTVSINQLAGRYRTATQTKSDLAIAATDLTATGTKDSTTFLRGDNTWAVPAGGGGGSSATTRNVTATGSLLSTDTVIICTGSGGITLTLPAANAVTPRPIQLEILNRTSGTVTLARAGSDLFEGDTTALINTGASWSITSDASANWYLY